jgi:hypothetical protein
VTDDGFETATIVKKWQDLVEAEEQYSTPEEEWIFRGDSCVRPLQPTLERIRVADYTVNRCKLENQLIRDFQRSYRIHAPIAEAAAKDDDILYWLSLMRHFGTPTRLLDFTYSFFIATFFALENQAQSDAVVWLISKTWLIRHNLKMMMVTDGEKFCQLWGERKPEAFNRIFFEERSPYKEGVFPVNPATSHHRLHLQQGLFLAPVNIERSFTDNLKTYEGHREKVLKVLIKEDCRDEILLKLHRAGTNRELLFPGLDGFAQGLASRTPILHSNLEKLAVSGARVPTDNKGYFLWGQIL